MKPTTRLDQIKLTILTDNIAFDHRLKTSWGYACLVETGQHTILFDTGGDGSILLYNMSVLGINPDQIEAVVISHEHDDHTGGLYAFTKFNNHAPVYTPQSFSKEFKQPLKTASRLVEVSGPVEIVEGIHSSGEIGTKIIEQAIFIKTQEGLVLITGCAHPGIVNILHKVEEFGEVQAIIGGSHLKNDKASEVQAVIQTLQKLGVRRAAPSHCTGSSAVSAFKDAFGGGYILAGAGAIIRF